MLRGIAALMVCIFHFSNGNKGFLSDNNLFRNIGSIGWSGVEVFFIISGFIIPYALYRTNYNYKDYGNFILKRFVRIHPPFIISIFLIVILNYLSSLSSYYKGLPFQLNFENLAHHFFYLSDFFNEAWLNPVYWTLSIEFQYYILIGLLFPLFVSKNNFISLCTITIFCLSKLLFVQPFFFFHYSPFFTIGILIFLSETNLFYKKIFWLCIPLILGFISYQFGQIVFFASIFSIFFLVFCRNIESKPVLFLGTISYSLYLIHVPIGGRIINLSKNFIDGDNLRMLVILIAISVTILSSYIFYRFIELPSIKLTNFFSKKFKNTNEKISDS